MLVSAKLILCTGKPIPFSIINYRYVKGKLPMNKPSTIGVEFATKNVELKNNQGIVKAQIWDTGNLHTYSFIYLIAGQERYKAITCA
jgi:GTPase SAR1 family protein